MLMLRVFRGKPKYVTVRSSTEPERREIPDNLWAKCEQCGKMIYQKELGKTDNVCGNCGHHFRLSGECRKTLILDDGSFQPFPALEAGDPLQFPGYAEKLQTSKEKSGWDDAVSIGCGQINQRSVVFGVIDFSFMGGSMGSVVGEQLTRGFEYAVEHRLPVVVFSGGGGGARMQEGIFSLMQMAKTSQAVGLHDQAGLLFISVLTDPTMGGIYASFASLGDIIIAEPKALIGFAGPRIVKETTRQSLPLDFQTAESALKYGMIDMIVERCNMRPMIDQLLALHSGGERG